MKKSFLIGAMTLGLGLIVFAATANATLIFNLGGCDFSSDTGGTGTCGGTGANLPYNALTMTFEQNGLDTVKLTIDADEMPIGTGKITDVWFNIDNLSFGDLTFNYLSGVKADDIIPGGNVFGAVGDFDINFEYKPSGNLGALNFVDKTSIYNISGTGLSEDNFNALSSGGYNAVMHVNVTGSGDSGHYVAPVPEPATMLLLGTGLAGLAGLRLRKKK